MSDSSTMLNTTRLAPVGRTAAATGKGAQGGSHATCHIQLNKGGNNHKNESKGRKKIFIHDVGKRLCQSKSKDNARSKVGSPTK